MVVHLSAVCVQCVRDENTVTDIESMISKTFKLFGHLRGLSSTLPSQYQYKAMIIKALLDWAETWTLKADHV